MITEDDLARVDAALAEASAGPMSLDVRGEVTAVVDGATGWDVMNDEPHESRAVAKGDQRLYLLAHQMLPRLAAEVRFMRRNLADMADDGKDVIAVFRYRQALEQIAAGQYGDGTDYSSIPHAHEIAAAAIRGVPS